MKGQKNGGEDGRREGGRRLGGLGWVEEGGRGRRERNGADLGRTRDDSDRSRPEMTRI